jgi:hypothetical protein
MMPEQSSKLYYMTWPGWANRLIAERRHEIFRDNCEKLEERSRPIQRFALDAYGERETMNQSKGYQLRF